MQEKFNQVSRYWGGAPPKPHNYHAIDPQIVVPFAGTHPRAIQAWLEEYAVKSFEPDPNHKLTKREKKHRWMMKVERMFGLDLTHKHYTLVKD
jgi:hypothetical protein